MKHTRQISLACYARPALAAKKEKKEEIFPPSGNLAFSDAITRELNVTVDGEPLKVTQYEDYHLADPLSTEQRISVYVPETATKYSLVILCVNNSGWMANSYASRTKVNQDDPDTVGEYSSKDDKDKAGMILSRGADIKAVIRYLRQNDDLLPAGDLDPIVITDTSGGGALSTLITSSGDSTDFLPYL